MNTEFCYAYAVGYYDGRVHGEENNPYDGNDERRAYYKHGYEAGVADYCREAHPEEQQ